jgi:hypothetical protein
MRWSISRLRFWGPLTLAFACMVVAQMVGPILTWVLVIFAFALILEVFTAWFEACGGTGGTHDHRQ